MEINNKMAILVLSCDNYSDLWDDFFNLRDKFWPDCPFRWYVVTETKDYYREGVEVIKCGKELNWAGRFRKAVHSVDNPLIGVFLEDYYISGKIDNTRITSLVDLMMDKGVDYLDLGNVFKHKINVPNNYTLYGLNTPLTVLFR